VGYVTPVLGNLPVAAMVVGFSVRALVGTFCIHVVCGVLARHVLNALGDVYGCCHWHGAPYLVLGGLLLLFLNGRGDVRQLLHVAMAFVGCLCLLTTVVSLMVAGIRF
jgi:hypothetical protein